MCCAQRVLLRHGKVCLGFLSKVLRNFQPIYHPLHFLDTYKQKQLLVAQPSQDCDRSYSFPLCICACILPRNGHYHNFAGIIITKEIISALAGRHSTSPSSKSWLLLCSFHATPNRTAISLQLIFASLLFSQLRFVFPGSGNWIWFSYQYCLFSLWL